MVYHHAFDSKQSTHNCVLEQPSKSGIAGLAPQTTKIFYLIRKCKKLFLVSEAHYLTDKLFRSSSMLYQEKRRQVKANLWYVIHPFSKIHIIVEIVMSIVWLGCFFLDMFIIGYCFQLKNRQQDYIYVILNVLDGITFIYVLLSFNLGYVEMSTNEIILNQKKIAITYAGGYLTFDMIGCLPIHKFYTVIMPNYSQEKGQQSTALLLAIMKACRIVRMPTMMEYSRQITQFMRISDTIQKIFCLVLIYVYLLHTCACFIFIPPSMEYIYYGNISSNSWIAQGSLLNASTFTQYINSLHTAMCHFMAAGTGMYKILDYKDHITFSFVVLVGFMYTVYLTAVVLQMVSSTSASESKYEELVHNLHEYAIRKKMPHMLRLRLLLYYENRFQKRYFRESAILSSLSEHLRYEILLHSCKHLFKKLTIFHGLSKTVLGTIIACLKQEVYLPNDVIVKADAPTESMFLIGYGTLALYTIDGLEIMHLEDGDHFGEVGLLRPDSDKLLNVVAIETSELYKLEKADFFRILHRYDDFAQRMQKAVAEGLTVVGKLQDHLSRINGKHDILNDLRHGKILEHSYRRNLYTFRK